MEVDLNELEDVQVENLEDLINDELLEAFAENIEAEVGVFGGWNYPWWPNWILQMLERNPLRRSRGM